MNKPIFRSVTYIRASVERVWDALMLPEFTEQYFFGTRIETDWKPQSDVAFITKDGRIAARGKVVTFDRPRTIVLTWSVDWSPQMAAEPPSRITYELARNGENARLTVTHDEFVEDSAVYAAVSMGWPGIISGLKTLLETGTPLPIVDDRPAA